MSEIDNLEKFIQEKINELEKQNTTIKKVTIHKGKKINLHLLFIKKDGKWNVLYMLSGQNPRNSISIPDSALDELAEVISKIIQNETLRKIIRKYNNEENENNEEYKPIL